MVETLARNWGWIALRGVAAILFGVITLFYPGITFAALVLGFGVYVLADGMFMVVSAIANRGGQPRWFALLIGGLLGIAAGIMTLVIPGATAIALLLLVAAWAIVTGVAEVVSAIRLRKEITGEWLFVVAGLLAVALGAILIARPGAGALVIAVWLSAYAVVSGVLLLAFSLRLRSWGKSAMHPPATPHGA